MNNQQPQQSITPQAAKQQIDNNSDSLTPQQWALYASSYPSSGRLGFIPNPHKKGQWIPANGADSVRVQSQTQINNDEITQDDTNLTPYKNGTPSGPTIR